MNLNCPEDFNSRQVSFLNRRIHYSKKLCKVAIIFDWVIMKIPSGWRGMSILMVEIHTRLQSQTGLLEGQISFSSTEKKKKRRENGRCLADSNLRLSFSGHKKKAHEKTLHSIHLLVVKREEEKLESVFDRGRKDVARPFDSTSQWLKSDSCRLRVELEMLHCDS